MLVTVVFVLNMSDVSQKTCFIVKPVKKYFAHSSLAPSPGKASVKIYMLIMEAPREKSDADQGGH